MDEDHYVDIPEPDNTAVPPINPYEKMGPLDDTTEYSNCAYDDKNKKISKGTGKRTKSAKATKEKSKFAEKVLNTKTLLRAVGVVMLGVALLLCFGLAIGGLSKKCRSVSCSSEETFKEMTVNLSASNFFFGDSGSLTMTAENSVTTSTMCLYETNSSLLLPHVTTSLFRDSTSGDVSCVCAVSPNQPSEVNGTQLTCILRVVRC